MGKNIKSSLILCGPLGPQQYPHVSYLKEQAYRIIGVDDDPNAVCNHLCDYVLNSGFKNLAKAKRSVLKIIGKNEKYLFSIGIISDIATEFFLALDLHFGIKNTLKPELVFNKKNLMNSISMVVSRHASTRKSKTNCQVFVAKPCKGSGSKDIIFSDEKLEIEWDLIKNDPNFFISKYIKGSEYSVDGYIYQGNIEFLLSFRTIEFRRTAKSIHTVLNHELSGQIKRYLRKIFQALQINDTVFHIELIIDSRKKIHLIDVGFRLGGYNVGSEYFSKATGINLFKVQLAIKEQSQTLPQISKTKPTAIFMFRLKDKFTGIFRENINTKNIENVSFFFETNSATKDYAVKNDSARTGYAICEFDTWKSLTMAISNNK